MRYPQEDTLVQRCASEVLEIGKHLKRMQKLYRNTVFGQLPPNQRVPKSAEIITIGGAVLAEQERIHHLMHTASQHRAGVVLLGHDIFPREN